LVMGVACASLLAVGVTAPGAGTDVHAARSRHRLIQRQCFPTALVCIAALLVVLLSPQASLPPVWGAHQSFPEGAGAWQAYGLGVPVTRLQTPSCSWRMTPPFPTPQPSLAETRARLFTTPALGPASCVHCPL